VFKTLSLKLAKYLARKLVLRQYNANSYIHRLEDPAQGIDLILAGQVCYLARNDKNEKVMLPPLPKLSVTGDTSLIGGNTPNMAELYAKSKAKLAHIPYEDILNVSVAFPPLKEQLMRHADAQKVSMMNAVSR
jgi:CRP-like cAMP-binding protein